MDNSAAGSAKKSYQMTVTKGDIVILPNGCLAIVTSVEIIWGGHIKEVRAYPFTNFLFRLLFTITGKTYFTDDEINQLRPIHIALCAQTTS